MQISIEKTEGLERILNVTVPSDKITAKVTEKLNEISKEVRIKGFRPGKVPKNILVQRYGSHARQEVLGDLINTTIQQAIKDNDLEIAERPEVTEVKDLDDGSYSFTAKLEIMPEIPEVDFALLSVSKEVSDVSEKDVNAMIEKLQKQKQEWKESKAKIADGDLITIEYVAKDGKKQMHPESGKEKMGILLGESGVPDDLINIITGLKKGESASAEIDFPDVFNVKEIAGKKVTFEFDVIDHKRGKLPKVDEKFVKEFGIESGKEEDLKAEIKSNLEREMANVVQAKSKESVLKIVRDEVKDVVISEKMIERESEALAHQAMNQAQQMGVENLPHPDHKDFVESAKERIINSLIIGKVAKEQNIQVDYTKVRAKVMEISQTFENPPQIVEYYYKNPELLASIENTVIEAQVVEWILSQVKVKEKKVSFDKMMESSL